MSYGNFAYGDYRISWTEDTDINHCWAYIDYDRVSQSSFSVLPSNGKILYNGVTYTVTDMHVAFSNCVNITEAPPIPSTVTNMANCFNGCTSLEISPDIPDSVTNIYGCFNGCSLLATAPNIPYGVTDMSMCFQDCENLTGNIIINANPARYDSCFYGTVRQIKLSGTSTLLYEFAQTSPRRNVTVAGGIMIHCKVNNAWAQGTPYIKANNAWHEVSQLLIKQNNTWTEI